MIDLDPQGQCATKLGMDSQMGTYYFLTTQPGSPSEVTFIRQWIRDTGRDSLQLIPGNSMTSAAQMMLGVQDQADLLHQRPAQNFHERQVGLHHF